MLVAFVTGKVSYLEAGRTHAPIDVWRDPLLSFDRILEIARAERPNDVITTVGAAGTFQEDADYLAAWYSGWYNGLAKAHRAKITRIKEDEHMVIVYCKAHPGDTIIHAIDVVFKGRKN